MRKLLLTFAVVLLLMPTMACAMSTCPINAEEQNAEQQMPCHPGMSEQSNADDMVMTILECMGLELFQTNVDYDAHLKTSLDQSDVVWAHLVADYTFDGREANVIRGPPRHLNVDPSQHSLYLKTQRLRI